MPRPPSRSPFPRLIALLAASAVIGGGLYFFSHRPARTDPSDREPILSVMVPAADPRFVYPQITDSPDRSAMERVNQALTEAYRDSGCGSDAPAGSTWNVAITVTYARNGVFGVHAGGDFDCGYGYPTRGYSASLTFDMTTGEEIPFERLFENYDRDREHILRAAYADVIARTAKFAALHPDDHTDCAGISTYAALADTPQDYAVSPDGTTLSLHPIYADALQACVPTVAVPVSTLLPFAGKGSLLNRVAR